MIDQSSLITWEVWVFISSASVLSLGKQQSNNPVPWEWLTLQSESGMLDRHLELESWNMIPGCSLSLVPQGLAISKQMNRQMKE